MNIHVIHGMASASYRRRNITRGKGSDAMSVGDVGSCDQACQTDLRHWPGGRDDAGEGRERGAGKSERSRGSQWSVMKSACGGVRVRKQEAGGSQGRHMRRRHPIA